ncbi:hypothetical protein HanRHA438_Chr14g0681691 [Helianthus annuus]|nr:hypothetical protein HanIR_Chr14g0727301 [Helianthus annuus]KAJ0856200.1 hypothetical protein HanRHA438_Chr14g0681691 [Helianthus annuus]
MVPENLFSPKSRTSRLVQFDKVSGSSPWKELLFRCSHCMEEPSFPREDGMVPDSRLELNIKTIRSLKFPKQSGRLPDNIFLERSRITKSAVLHNESGIDPLKRLFLRSSNLDTLS